MPSKDEYPTTCYIYSGFGGSERSGNPQACRLVEQLDEGRRPESTGLAWSHYIEVPLSVDIRDGVTRSAGSNTLTYGDGDEVRIPDTSGTKYVVVFVFVLAFGTPYAKKRVLLMRDAPVFTGTGWS